MDLGGKYGAFLIRHDLHVSSKFLERSVNMFLGILMPYGIH